jgi:hypothetical protein
MSSSDTIALTGSQNFTGTQYSFILKYLVSFIIKGTGNTFRAVNKRIFLGVL